MQEPTRSASASIDPVGLLAGEVLKDLYRAVCGHEPSTVRAYRDDDAILLLLRFDPAEHEYAQGEATLSPQLETAFLAMPGMIVSAVEARTGRRLAAGNLSVCAERGLAVLAFSALEGTVEPESDEDLFRIDAGTLSVAKGKHRHLRLAG
jgi:hypothetical protein